MCRNRDTAPVGRLRKAYEAVARRRWAIVTIQLVALTVVLFFAGWAFRGAWHDAEPRLRRADFSELAFSTAILAAYYLLFTLGWLWMLAAWGLRVPYIVALQAEICKQACELLPHLIPIVVLHHPGSAAHHCAQGAK